MDLSLSRAHLLAVGRMLTVSQAAVGVAAALAVGLIVLVLFLVLRRRRNNARLAAFPSLPAPKPWLVGLLIGHFSHLFGGKTPPVLLSWVKKYGLLMRFEAPLQATRVVVCDPAVLKDVLVLRPYTFVRSTLLVRQPSCSISLTPRQPRRPCRHASAGPLARIVPQSGENPA